MQIGFRQIEIGKKIGGGKFGRIYTANDKQTLTIIAVKIIDHQKIKRFGSFEQLQREIDIHSSISHPNIITFYGYFKGKDTSYLFLEHAKNGNLYTHLQNQENERFPEPIASGYIRQIARGLAYLHRNHICHRDLKPENILMTSSSLKICDFGLSIRCEIGKKIPFECVGTMDYLAPEMIKKQDYDLSIDLWALGVLIYDIIAGYPPFMMDSQDETFDRICAVDYIFPNDFSKNVRNLIQNLLVYCPENRISIEKVKQDPWVLE